MKGLTMLSHGAVYRLSPENASDQFRYWVMTNQHNYEAMLLFFNLMNDNKLVKEGAKIILDSIKTNTKIYVPMLTKKLTMAE